MTTYRKLDKVITPSGSHATYQWSLGDGKCKVWILREDWKEPEPYPRIGPTAPVILDEAGLKPSFLGVRK